MQQLNIKTGPNYLPLVLCIVISAAAVVFFTYPKYNDLLLKREQLQKAQESLQNFNDDYNLVLKAINTLDNPDVANLSVALPTDANIPHLYAHLEQLSQNAKLHLVSVNAVPEDSSTLPAASATPTHYLITPSPVPPTVGILDITLAVMGPYTSQMQLIGAIKSSLRILDIQQFDIQADKSTPSSLSARYLIRAYYEKTN